MSCAVEQASTRPVAPVAAPPPAPGPRIGDERTLFSGLADAAMPLSRAKFEDIRPKVVNDSELLRNGACGLQAANINNSKEDTRTRWLKLWKEETYNDECDGPPLCAVDRCGTSAKCGGHVWVRGRQQGFIVPLCGHHNGCEYDWEGRKTCWMDIIPGTDLVQISSHHTWGAGPRHAGRLTRRAQAVPDDGSLQVHSGAGDLDGLFSNLSLG